MLYGAVVTHRQSKDAIDEIRVFHQVDQLVTNLQVGIQDERAFLCRKCRNLLKLSKTRMWANAQPDGRPAKHRWRPLFNAAKFG